MLKHVRSASLALLLASSAAAGVVQSAAFAQDVQTAPQAATPVAAAPIATRWSRGAAEELLRYVDGIGAEGLSPASYGPDRLRSALSGGDEAALNQAATDIFLKLTADLSGGQVRGAGRVQWFMPPTEVNGNEQQRLLGQAQRGGVAEILNSLLPTHAQYAGLKRALAKTPESDTAKREIIMTNLERWRWMPRNLGPRHVIVNVPAYTAAVVDEGRVVARHRTVVGATRTPTPQLVSNAVAVTFNPWWNVPQSIVREMRSFAGYEVRQADGYRIVRQAPGPRNSLGRVKIEMPNDHAIYLHDTPAQALFARDARAYSHGCIRTQNIRDFAALLLNPTGRWDRAEIDQTIASGENVRANLAAPVPVYIAYFTAAATSDGDIVTYRDIYGRDAPVKRALTRTS